MRFYLTVTEPSWLWRPEFADVPLFISHRRLRRRKTPYPTPAGTRYAVDSGAFTELTTHGRWMETPEQYVAALRGYWRELGAYDFAAQQDHVCLPAALDMIEQVTGVRPTVDDQILATVENFLVLRKIAPDLRVAPSLQGATVADYLLCADLFELAGVDLAAEPVVGVGSLVGRPPADVELIASTLQARGIANLHGFGVAKQAVRAAVDELATADSSAWSYQGRRNPLPDCPHPQCQNCPRYALHWRNHLVDSLGGPRQLALIA